MKRTFALSGRLTRYRTAVSLRRGWETVMIVEGPGGVADVTITVPVDQLPFGVDVDDVHAEVYVVLLWGEQPSLPPGVQVLDTTGTET